MNTTRPTPRLNCLREGGKSLLPVGALLGMLILLSPGSSSGADFKELLSGKICPLSVKLGDLNGDWRRITVRTDGNASGNVSVSVTGSGGTSGSSQNNIADLGGSKSYVTCGQTVSANGQTYLVAYHLPGSGLDLTTLIQATATKLPPPLSKLSPETVLPLSLLDLKSAGSLDDIKAFDLRREIVESEKLAQTISSAIKGTGGGTKNDAEPVRANNPAK